MTAWFDHISQTQGLTKILWLVVMALCAHLLVKGIDALSPRLFSAIRSGRTKTVASLSTSLLVFVIYFITIGVILQELGVSLGTYIASASVIGIAVGFGTQNLVQDVINGLTILLTDLFTVGDMVEISGQVGIVQEVSMRFVILKNPMGANVYLPTRTVTNVILYPKGYVRCLVDISLDEQEALANFKDRELPTLVDNMSEQFPNAFRAIPEIGTIDTLPSGKHYLRVKFRIWPGRGSQIETTFKQDIVTALKHYDSELETANAVAINYEVG